MPSNTKRRGRGDMELPFTVHETSGIFRGNGRVICESGVIN